MKQGNPKILFFFAIVFLVSGCGKKLPPTSPDRWAPRVLNVNPVDEHHLCVYFSERLDTLTPQKTENFRITNQENSETTSVIYSERARKGDEVLLTIPKLKEGDYSLLVFNIKDISGNLMKRAEKSFKPNNEKDTIPPVLKRTKPMRVNTSAPQDSIIILMFSEPMDTEAIKAEDFLLTNIEIDSLLVWNETLTELTVRYRLIKDIIGKIFLLPRFVDLSGNPIREMRVLTLTTNDTLPKTRFNIKIAKDEKKLVDTYAFVTYAKDGLFEDISPVDTTLTISLYFVLPDTYLISVISKDSVDTTGLWWGQKKTPFFPDSTRSMNENINLGFVKKEKIPDNLFDLYNTLATNLK